jgi:hypothetical protein
MNKLGMVEFLMIIFIYIVYTRNRKLQGCHDDDLIRTSVMGNETLDTNYDLFLFLFPIYILLSKSKTEHVWEHIIYIYIYTLSIKSVQIVSNPNKLYDLIHPFMWISGLIIIFNQMVEKNQITTVYLYCALFSLFRILKRKINTTQCINDVMTAHVIFYLCK